jgi:hypothetical protein
VAGKPKDPRLDEALLLKELADTRREVRNLTVMGMRPDVSADEREIIHNLERSARAQVKMGIKALQYCSDETKTEPGLSRPRLRTGKYGCYASRTPKIFIVCGSTITICPPTWKYSFPRHVGSMLTIV